MTAEEARVITRRAIIVKYVKAIDECIYNAAERGEYSTVKSFKNGNGYSVNLPEPVMDDLINHYRSQGYVANKHVENKELKNPIYSLKVEWNEQPKEEQKNERDSNEPRIEQY